MSRTARSLRETYGRLQGAIWRKTFRLTLHRVKTPFSYRAYELVTHLEVGIGNET